MKRVIVTGANSGMGKALSKELLKRGYEVIMACRSEKRGQAAYNEILAELDAETGTPLISSDQRLVLELCDLSSFRSILDFCSRIRSRYDIIDVLINNAGVILLDRQETADGFEMQLGVNHFGHFLLTRELLPLLKSAPEGRIVVVSSGAHKVGKIHFNDLQLTRKYSAIRSYAQSKLANLLYVKAMAAELEGSRVTINALHPGAVGTNMGVNRENGFGAGLLKFLSYFFLTPLQGAQTALYLADSPDVQGKTGGYYYKNKLARTARSAQNRQLISRLYDETCRLTDEKLHNL